MVFLHDRINSQDYSGILSDKIHPIVEELLPKGNAFFQGHNASIQADKTVTEW